VGNVRMLGAHGTWLANATLFRVSLCRPTAPGLPMWVTGDFGTSPIFSNSPTSHCLPVHNDLGCRNAKHND
jgi:hypothetical protein